MAIYKKFIIQQQTFDGSEYTNVGSAVDTYKSFGIVCSNFPFKHMPEIKDLPKREWPDEDGEDVFIPSNGIKFSAYDVEGEFLYAGEVNTMKQNVVSFIEFIRGKNSDGSPLLCIYDEYTQTGRRGVYVVDVDTDKYDYDDMSITGISVIKVKFRVTDPAYNAVLSVSSD